MARKGKPHYDAVVESFLAENRACFSPGRFQSVRTSSRDVDFLVDLEPERSLSDVGGLVMDLQNLLGLEVALVAEKELHWYIRDRVIAEARPL